MDGPSPATRSARIPPIAIAAVAILLGCVLDAVIKQLGLAYSAVLIAFVRYVFGSLFAGAAMLAAKRPWPAGSVLRRHAIRAVVVTATTVLFFVSLQKLPIAEATVLLFGAPLLIPPLARWLLKEKLRGWAVAALAIGFAGMLVTIQGAPLVSEANGRLEGVAAGVAAALLYALSLVLLRQVSKRDDAVTTAFLSNIFPGLYLLAPAVLLGVAPQPADLFLLAAAGLIGFVLWFLMSAAYARAAAQTIAPAEYTALIWSALLGYVFFQETPRWQVWAGAAVICAAVMLAAWDGRRAAKAGGPDLLG